MSDLSNLLQDIFNLLNGWFSAFTAHVVALMSKLDLIEDDTDSINSSASDIKNNTDDIKSNTGAIVTPVQTIKTNTDSIKTDTNSIKNNVSTMTNQLTTISTNVGTASSFAEDVANNTLDIKDKITTIASDTTQIRTNTNSTTTDVSEIKNLLQYYFITNIVTEDSEGTIANFDTDLSDYLQDLKITIPADNTGFTGITLNKIGANLCPTFTGDNTNGLTTTVSSDGTIHVTGTATGTGGIITSYINFPFTLKSGTQITASITNVLNTNLRMVFNNGVIDIPAGAKNRTATLSSDVVSGRLYLFTTANQSYDLTFKFQLEIGSSASSYELYKNMSYPVSFGTTITDGGEADLLNGIVRIDTTPLSYISITPIAVKTYKGVNNIYSDVGDTSLTYRETLKHYLDKRNQ